MDIDTRNGVITLGGTLLCLKCRYPGHYVHNCPSKDWSPEMIWPISQPRKLFNVDKGSEMTQSVLCQRCTALDISRLLNEDIEWNSRQELNSAASSGSRHIRAIGKTGSIQYWSDCPLCLCLFALTPNPSSEDQDVVIFPDWTIYRLEGAIILNTIEKRRYAKCLIVSLQPSPVQMSFQDRAMLGDALCFLEENLLEEDKVLGGREILADRIDTELISKWLSSCQRLHPLTCSSYWTEALQNIKLLNVHTRQVVQYPGQPCEYIALSYVWGNFAKQSIQLGSTLPLQLAQTIEDAMQLTGALGKQYLWVDSLCIDQFNEDDKRAQIGKMSDIYRGAYATIIALSGTSANAGLPRMRHNQEAFPQLRCRIDGKQMVGLMPRLTKLIPESAWGKRAWTLQEAILSRRCIYVTDFQLYFECNAMQCSESLDETRSYIHQLFRDGNADWSFGNIGAGDLRQNLHRPGIARDAFLSAYGSKLVLYSERSMTEPEDAINAFSGILQDLERDHGTKFHFGLPVQYFQWGLLWTAQRNLKRRKPDMFPSWSWAGWEGALWQVFPPDLEVPHRYPSWFTIQIISDRQPHHLFSSTADTIGGGTSKAHFRDDPMALLGQQHQNDPSIDLSLYPDAKKDGFLLLVEGIVFRFNPDYDRLLSKAQNGPDKLPVIQQGRFTLTHLLLNNIPCQLRAIANDGGLEKRPSIIERDFLLVAREYENGYINHWLLLLEFHDVVAERVAVMSLGIPETNLGLLWSANPRKRRFLLA